MIFEQNRPAFRVYLAESTDDMKKQRGFLQNVLRKSGLDVIDNDAFSETSIPPEVWRNIKAVLSQTHCSIHVLGKKYGKLVDEKNKLSLHELEYRLAQEYSHENDQNYRIFIWHPEFNLPGETEPAQEVLVNNIKNNTLHNVFTSQAETPVMLVEDIHVILQSQLSANITTRESDIFFIYNELDDDSAPGIIDLLYDVMKVEVLKISQNSSSDQSAFLVEQVKASKMAVIYYNFCSDWAYSFTRQLWKTTGGASSRTPILLIGDIGNNQETDQVITAPNVSTAVLAGELIPLEIKVRFDNMKGNE